MPPSPSPIVKLVRRVPPIVWALIAPAVIIVGVKLWSGGTERVMVVGAGVLASLGSGDAPEGFRYVLAVQEHETATDTLRRGEEAIRGWPHVIVFGLDGSHMHTEADAREGCASLARLAEQVDHATGVPVLVNTVLPEGASADQRASVESFNRCWRLEVCQKGGRRLCVDVAVHGGDPEAVRRAVAAGVVDANGRFEAWRASTQVGR